MFILKRFFSFAPVAMVTFLILWVPLNINPWIRFCLLCALLIAGLFQRTLYLETGKLGARKRVELAACSLLLICYLSSIHSAFLFWPVVPLFLFFVGLGFTIFQLIFLLAVFGGVSYFWFHFSLDQTDYLMLEMVIFFAVLFRYMERRNKAELQKKIDSFEAFEKRFSSDEEELLGVSGLQAKKNFKIGELVLEQEKRFDQFVDLIYSIFDPYSALLYTYNPILEEFDLQAMKSKSNLEVRPKIPLKGLFKAVESQKKSILFLSKDEITDLDYYTVTPRVTSVIITPIYDEALLVGLIVVDQDRKEFVQGHVQVLEKMAPTIAQLTKDTETIYSYFKLKEELSSFYSASSMLNQTFNLQNVFDVFLKTSHEIAPFDLAFLVIFDSNTKVNRIVAQYGEFEDWIGDTFSLSPSKGLISWTIENRKPLFYENYRLKYDHSPLFHKKMKVPNIFESVCIIPLVAKEEILGATVFLCEKNKAFSPSVRKILEVLSTQSSIAIKNAKMVRDLEQLATTDGLTGLINHRSFQKQLIYEIERAKRTGTSLSLILIDLDHFKKINDNYGHPIGDFVLKEVASFLKASVRNVDCAARYGGEEFAIILPNTSSQEAYGMAKRMGDQIRKKEMIDQGIKISVTFSMGISTYPEHAVLKEQLIDFADTALYHSKKTGRNRATLFTKNLKMVDFAEKEHILIQKAEIILREQ